MNYRNILAQSCGISRSTIVASETIEMESFGPWKCANRHILTVLNLMERGLCSYTTAPPMPETVGQNCGRIIELTNWCCGLHQGFKKNSSASGSMSSFGNCHEMITA